MIEDIKMKARAYEVVIQEYKEKKDKLLKELKEKKEEYYMLEARRSMEAEILGSESIDSLCRAYSNMRSQILRLEHEIEEITRALKKAEKQVTSLKRFLQ